MSPILFLTNSLGIVYYEDMTIQKPRRPFLAATLLTVSVLLAACSSSGSSSSPTTTSSSSGASNSSIPAGTVLRVGDQLSYLKTILSLSGEDANVPYQIQYSQFVGGPPMLQAFQGGALDVGFVGSTPLIFAQAAGQPLTAVAAWTSKGSAYGLLTSPGSTSVTGWASLKGKRVAYQQGTAGEAVLLEGLHSAKLSLSDVTTVNLPQTQVNAALQGGSADAGIQTEPLTSVYLQANPTAKQVASGDQITDRSSFLIASKSALSSKATEPAIADFVTRLVTAFAYLRAHPAKVTAAVFVGQYGLSPARAATVEAEIGGATFTLLPGAILPAQQQLADLFHAAGQIPNQINVGSEFDSRYNALITATQGS